MKAFDPRKHSTRAYKLFGAIRPLRVLRAYPGASYFIGARVDGFSVQDSGSYVLKRNAERDLVNGTWSPHAC